MKKQPLLGFIFALITAMAWGSLAIALKQVVAVINAQTIIFYRFSIAALALIVLLGIKRKLPKLHQFTPHLWRLVFIGVLGLAGNFFFFNSSLNYVDPAVTQIFIHLSSFTMLICGVLIFKEKIGVHQKIGLLLLVIGLGLFFNERFDLLLKFNVYSTGVILSVIAALVWVGYGLAQKLMLHIFSSQQILMMMYIGCALLFMPFADIGQVRELDGFVFGCFVYCCLNTLIGYGAYAEALTHWEVSKVSVIITLVPLFTILFMHLSHYLVPTRFVAPELNFISYLGAFIVVLGAMLSAIGHKLIKDKKVKNEIYRSSVNSRGSR